MDKIPAGGQAVIEGVMMKTPHYYSLGVRKPDNSIHVESIRYKSISEKFKFLKWPFFRGIINLVEMLVIGLRSLMKSAEISSDEEEKISTWALILTVVLAFAFGIGLFVLLPYIITYLFGFSEESNAVLFNAVDGLIKIVFFAIYVYLISFMEDIKRTFQYHGAEHKAVNCYEDGKSLTIDNCMKYKTFHPRCGTSFVMFVFFVMIIVFSLIPPLVSVIYPNISQMSLIGKRLLFFGVRLLFIFPVASISFEVLKLSFRFKKYWFMRLLQLPGRLLQGITTKEPSRNMVEVAVKTLKAVVAKEIAGSKPENS